MVNMLASSSVGREFKHQSCQIKEYEHENNIFWMVTSFISHPVR